MRQYLPVKTAAGFITGIPCDDWMVLDKKLWPYSTCCQDPRNWEGRGEWREIAGAWQTFEGGTHSRDAYCKVCNVHVNGHEIKRFVREQGDGGAK